MFLRKLTVIFVPLLLAAGVCALLPVIGGLGFFSWVLLGVTLGAALALLLPLSGAGKKKEPFAGLLWIPAGLLALTVAYQYVSSIGLMHMPLLQLLETTQSNVVLVECVFVSYMTATCVRTKR